MASKKTVGILGAGAWGTAFAQALAHGGHEVTLWAMEDDVVSSINDEHENKRFLKGFELARSLKASKDIEEVASDKEFLVLASPSLYLASTIKKILGVKNISEGTTNIGVLTKGFVPSESGPRLILETMESVLPPSYTGSTCYISGPSHAEEVAMGKLTGLVAASENPRISIEFRELMRVQGIMPYSSLDVVGVQICAAAKNVVAVVYGALDALSETSEIFGDNTESLLVAAGLNEIQTLGFAMGATHAETFTSISGVGDLDVTCKSKYGRNRRFGQEIIKTDLLSRFKDLDDLIANINKIGYLPEGAVACKCVHEVAQSKNLKLLICDGLFRILNREIEPEDFMLELLMDYKPSE